MKRKNKGNRRNEENDEQPRRKVITQAQLMDKSHMDRTTFIPMLTQQSLYGNFDINKEQTSAIRKILIDFNYLLYGDFKCFWSTLLYNPTLKRSLVSCLAYLHRRWLNKYLSEENNEVKQEYKQEYAYHKIKYTPFYQYTEALFQVLLVFYYRMTDFVTQNAELSQLYKLNEAITQKNLLDIPRLLQLIELYGQNNPEAIRTITRRYLQTMPNNYTLMSQQIIPIMLKRVTEVTRSVKTLTERQQFGIQYSYKRLNNREFSPGQQQLRRKGTILLQLISFVVTMKNIINYFPECCVDYCYFNCAVGVVYQNIFFELELAYLAWNYQQQEKVLLPMMNYVMEEVVIYWKNYFQRIDTIMVKISVKNGAIEAYVKSLERILKDYGKRVGAGKKAAGKRSLVLYKLVQKGFDLNGMLQTLYMNQLDNQMYEINIDCLIEFKLALEKEMEVKEVKEDNKKVDMMEDQPSCVEQQRGLCDEAAAEQADKNRPAQDEPNNTNLSNQKLSKQGQLELKTIQPACDILQLQKVIPKRARADDYYQKLYSEYESRYKQEYDDEYDDLVDYDKKPLFIDEESSNDSESDEEHLVTNMANLQQLQKLHSNNSVKQTKQAKYGGFKSEYKEQGNGQVSNMRNNQRGNIGNGRQVEGSQKGSRGYQGNRGKNKNDYFDDSLEDEDQRIANEGLNRKDETHKPKYIDKAMLNNPQTSSSIINNNVDCPDPVDQQKDPDNNAQPRYRRDNRSHNYVPKSKPANNDRGRNNNKQKPTASKKYTAKY